jgi:hypothetical protein
MLALIFYVFSLVLISVRLLSWQSMGYKWMGIDILSALFFFLGFFFALFPETAIATTLVSYNGLMACNSTACIPYNYTSNTTSLTIAAIPVNSYQFILLSVVTVFYVIIMVIFLLFDFLETQRIIKEDEKRV